MPNLNQDLLREALNSQFTIQTEEKPTTLILTECTDQTSPEVPDYERFSLIFESSDPLLEQNTYSLQHQSLGDFDLFLVPVHGDDKGFQYEAIINKLNNPD